MSPEFRNGFSCGFMAERKRVISLLRGIVVPRTGKPCRTSQSLALVIERAQQLPPVDVVAIRAADEFDDIDEGWGQREDTSSTLIRLREKLVVMQAQQDRDKSMLRALRKTNKSLKLKLSAKRA